ncbi:MAG: divergent polysaccharide deacetylase family protein, partial [Desulfobacterales bacterium]
MAKRKPTRTKRRPKKPRKKASAKRPLFKALAGLAIVAVVVIATGVLLYYLIPPTPASKATPSPPAKTSPPRPKPTFEIYPKETGPPARPLAKKNIPQKIPEPVTRKTLPLVALIIDDLGYDKKIAKEFAQLDGALTFSILPHSPFQQSIARLAASKGLEIMLHLPMEP